MIHLKRITTTAALAVCLAVPGTSTARPADPQRPVTSPATQQAETVDLRSPDARDAGRTIVQNPEPTQIAAPTGDDGFQWGDAGIGAAGTLALALVLGSLGGVAGQRRRVSRSTVASR
jgi:hypothetical protein